MRKELLNLLNKEELDIEIEIERGCGLLIINKIKILI